MASVPLRERKKAKTKSQLIAIAYELFLEKGFEQTTVDEIVARAELSQRTFFRYFPTKESVVFWDHQRRSRRLQDVLLGGDDRAGACDRIGKAVDEIIAFYQRNRRQLLDEYRIVTASPHLTVMDTEQDLGFEQVFATSLGRDATLSGMDEQTRGMLAGAIFGALKACLGQWFESGCNTDLAVMGKRCRELIDVLMTGFCSHHPESTVAT